MRNRLRVAALLLILAILGGCGGTRVPEAASSEEPPADFGVSFDSDMTPQLQEEAPAPAETADSARSSQEASPNEAETGVGEAQAPPAAPAPDETENVAKSILLCLFRDGLSYDPRDPVFYWRAMGYYLILAGEDTPGAELEGEWLRIPARSLEPIHGALFGDYDGQAPSLGEENPLVSWESTDRGEFYLVTPRDLSQVSVELETPSEGTCGALIRDGEEARRYVLHVIPGDPASSFPWRVTGAERDRGN